jgi:putative ABC transport system substrate-binding protein
LAKVKGFSPAPSGRARTNPGDIPYFQATKFELVINMKAAKELGLEIPAGLVAAVAVIK